MKIKPVILILMALLISHQALPAFGASAIKSRRRDPFPVASQYIRYSKGAIRILNRKWRHPSHAPKSWVNINAWQRFVIVDAIADYTMLSHDNSYLSIINRAVRNHTGLSGNDDDLWAIIASLKIYGLTGDASLLNDSRIKFDELTKRYWDNRCGGGIWWDHARSYKNAITNELLLYVATLLYRLTGENEYYGWAKREWEWFESSGMINKNKLVNDGLNEICRNNDQPTYTYNQGAILGGLTNLYLISKDKYYLHKAVDIANAAVNKLTSPRGILREPEYRLSEDSKIFKGIFMRYLSHLVAIMPAGENKRNLVNFITRNAEFVHSNDIDRKQEVDAYWVIGVYNVHLYGAAAQSAAVDLFNSAYRVVSDTGEPRYTESVSH